VSPWAIEDTRIDQWLWSVRIYRTRSAATAACRGGHVKLNGRAAKAAAVVRVGDRIETFVAERHRVLEVSRLIDKRVGAPVAADCLVDHSPTPPSHDAVAQPMNRERGSGRPTKRDRRALDRVRDARQPLAQSKDRP